MCLSDFCLDYVKDMALGLVSLQSQGISAFNQRLCGCTVRQRSCVDADIQACTPYCGTSGKGTHAGIADRSRIAVFGHGLKQGNASMAASIVFSGTRVA